jgi:signal transduction histidine kinase
VLYSTDKSLIGRTFPIGIGLAMAFAGNYYSDISDLSDEENRSESRHWPRLIETYVPLHGEGLGRVIAAAEFYQTTEELDREARSAQLKSWLAVAATLLGIYLLLFGLVRRGSQTIGRQRRDLNNKVLELTALNAQNEQLNDRIRRAAARATALNETYLRLISADLHDGPGQDLGLALVQIDAVRECGSACPSAQSRLAAGGIEVNMVRSSLRSALADLRAIATGLQLPDIAGLSINEVAARAVRDYEGKTSVKVELVGPEEDIEASLPVKITLYRLLQESLANGFRHAGGIGQHVELARQGDQVIVEVSDHGAGFDPHAALEEGHLGLTGMRERVEVLGGTFRLRSAAGEGTMVRICLPLSVPGVEHA